MIKVKDCSVECEGNKPELLLDMECVVRFVYDTLGRKPHVRAMILDAVFRALMPEKERMKEIKAVVDEEEEVKKPKKGKTDKADIECLLDEILDEVFGDDEED